MTKPNFLKAFVKTDRFLQKKVTKLLTKMQMGMNQANPKAMLTLEHFSLLKKLFLT